jgi:probable DNA metabolism protein
VYEAHARKQFPDGIYVGGEFQQSLCETIDAIDTDAIKAERVRRGILDKLGSGIYENMWTAFLSNDPERYTKISRYLRLAFAVGGDVAERLADPAVFDIFMICRNVGRETNKLVGFIRFSVMENNVQYAEITPDHNQIPIIMQHFAERLREIPFIIHDSRRRIAGLYDGREWYVADAGDLSPPKLAEDEELIRSLWKTFYKTIAIESRINPKLQRNLMPKKYWRNMTEHN